MAKKEEQEKKDEDKSKTKPRKKYNREKKECSFPKCNAKVTHLPRHLRNMHKWSREMSRTVVHNFKGVSKNEKGTKKKET